ncbi:MAG TPA: GAF and ANTAR domain-containing protein [Streptosporangiaceae bacterium]|nr:GAF and ANTAR domain-containing protein [Streptosporangiaceae bacterium]
MVRLTRQLAERVAELARLMLDDEGSDTPLHELTTLALELIPGSVAAGVVAASDTSWVFTGSPATVADLHRTQLQSGTGPVAEAIRHGEARRIDDTGLEQRWPAVCAAMAGMGLDSCLVLPLRTDHKPGGALAVYGGGQDAFAGAGQDLALLFAAQGGVAIRNAAAYRNCRQLVANLQVALESRAVIEQAKGILVAEYGCHPEVAFKELSRISQSTNRKVRDIATDLVAGRIDRSQFGPGPA